MKEGEKPDVPLRLSETRFRASHSAQVQGRFTTTTENISVILQAPSIL